MKKWLFALTLPLIALAGFFFIQERPTPLATPTAQPPAATWDKTVSSDSEKTEAHTLDATPKKTSLFEQIYKGSISTVDDDVLIQIKDELSEEKMLELAGWATDITLSGDTRQVSLYILTQMGEKAIPALTVIATTPLKVAPSYDPHSVNTFKYSQDIGLRVTAIEALDNNTQRPDLILPVMQQVLEKQKERSLVLLAQISISGIQSGNAGKVQRAIEDMFKGNN